MLKGAGHVLEALRKEGLHFHRGGKVPREVTLSMQDPNAVLNLAIEHRVLMALCVASNNSDNASPDPMETAKEVRLAGRREDRGSPHWPM